MKVVAYLRLMRFHKPVGIMLLWFPTAWALWIANQGYPSAPVFLYFFLGTVIMRAAGCVVNDIADRNIDKHVKRTRLRPLTTGEVGLPEAMGILFILLSAALYIVLQLPFECLYYAIAALLITLLYPFCKRFFQAPQLILGIAFSMAIPMVYSASNVSINAVTLLLMLLNIAWVIAYDTMYAMVDRADDLQIGVRSTAVLFARFDALMIFLLQTLCHGLWLVIAVTAHFTKGFYFFWCAGALILAYQQRLVNTRNEAACFRAFLMNAWYGMIMWLGLITSV